MDEDAVADQRVGDCRERPDVAMAADRDARADDGASRDAGTGADLGLASDDGARLDQNAVLETGRRVDRRGAPGVAAIGCSAEG